MRMPKPRKWWLLLPLALALTMMAALACEKEEVQKVIPTATPAAAITPVPTTAPAAVPGVSDTEIVLGSHIVRSGNPAAALYSTYAQGLETYFRYVNEELGGACNRRVILKIEDDQYDPARAAEAVRKLLEQDKVFAIVGSLGTPTHSAVWEYLNREKVPDLFISSGARKWGADPEKYPYSIGFIPDYFSEGTIFGRFISENFPGKKVGILYQNDDFGQDGRQGVRNGLDPDKNQIVSEQSYEATATDIRSQIINLRRAGTEVLVLYALPGFTAQAIKETDRLGWRRDIEIIHSYPSAGPMMFTLTSRELMEGVFSAYYMKPYDMTDDPAVANHQRVMRDYGGPTPGPLTIYAHLLGDIVMETLRRTCDSLTREGLMDAAESLRNWQSDLALPGVMVNLSDGDHYAIQTLQMVRATNGRYEPYGPLVSAGE